MERANQPPYFTLHIEAPGKHFCWCIAQDGVVMHKISNIRNFSKDIGYPDVSPLTMHGTDYVSDKEISVEHHEFISHPCTQIKINAYLNVHSEKYRAKHTADHSRMLEACKTQQLIIDAETCAKCMMRRH